MNPSLDDVMLLLQGWMKDETRIKALLFRDEFTRSVIEGKITLAQQGVVKADTADKKSGILADLRNAVTFTYADQRQFGERGKDYTDIVQAAWPEGWHFAVAVLV